MQTTTSTMKRIALSLLLAGSTVLNVHATAWPNSPKGDGLASRTSAPVQIQLKAFMRGPYGENLYQSDMGDLYTAEGKYYGYWRVQEFKNGWYTILYGSDGSRWWLDVNNAKWTMQWRLLE
jgi:hypothetical protein